MFIEPETNDAKPRLCSELDDAEKLQAFKLFLQGNFSIYRGCRYGFNLICEDEKIVLEDLSGNIMWKDETGFKQHLTAEELIEICEDLGSAELERKLILKGIEDDASDDKILPGTGAIAWEHDKDVLIKDENNQPICTSLNEYKDLGSAELERKLILKGIEDDASDDKILPGTGAIAWEHDKDVLIKDENNQSLCLAPNEDCGTYKWDMLPQILFNDPDLLRSFFSIDPYATPFYEIKDFGERYLNFVLRRCWEDDELDLYTLPFLCRFDRQDFCLILFEYLKSAGKVGEDATAILSLKGARKILGLLISEAPIGPEGSMYKGGVFAKATDQLDVDAIESDLIRNYYLFIRGLDGDVGEMLRADFAQDLQQAEDQMVKFCCNNESFMVRAASEQFADSIQELISAGPEGEKLSWCGDKRFFFEKLINVLIAEYYKAVHKNDKNRLKHSQDWIISAYKDILNLSDKDKLELRQLRPNFLKGLEGFATGMLCSSHTNPLGYEDCRKQVDWDDKSRARLFGRSPEKSGAKVDDPAQDTKHKQEAPDYSVPTVSKRKAPHPRLCSELDDAEKLRAFKLFLQGKFSIYKGFKYGLDLSLEHNKMVLKDLQGNVMWRCEDESRKHLTRDEFREIPRLNKMAELEGQLILKDMWAKPRSYFISPPRSWAAHTYADDVLIEDENNQPICIAPKEYCGTYKWDMLSQILFNDPELLRSFFSIDPFGPPLHAIKDFGQRYLNFVLQECLKDDNLDHYSLSFLCRMSPQKFYDLVVLRLNRKTTTGEHGTQTLSLEVAKKILGLLISEAPIGPEGTGYKGGVFAHCTNKSNVGFWESGLISRYYIFIRGLEGDLGEMLREDFAQDLQQVEDQMVKFCCNTELFMVNTASEQFVDSIRELISVSQKGERLSWCGEKKFLFEKLIQGWQDQYYIGVSKNDKNRVESSETCIICAYQDILDLPDKEKLVLRQLRPELLRSLERFVAYTLCNPQTNPLRYEDRRRKVGWYDKSREGLCSGSLDGSGEDAYDPIREIREKEGAQQIKDKEKAVQLAEKPKILQKGMIYGALSILLVGVAYLACRYVLRVGLKVAFSSLAAPARGRGVLK